MLAQEYLISLLSVGRTEKVLELLKILAPHLDNTAQNQITLLSSRHSTLKKEIGEGILSKENRTLEKNQIDYALNKIIKTLPENLELDPTLIEKEKLSIYKFLKKRSKFLVAAIWALILIAFLISINMKKKGIDMKLNMNASRVQFTNEKNGELQINNEYSYAFISGFADVEIPAETIQLKQNNSDETQEYVLNDNYFRIQGMENNEYNIGFENVFMENLEIEEDLDIVVDMHNELKEELLISLMLKNGKISGQLVLQDTLFIECNYCQLFNNNGKSEASSFRYGNGNLIGPAGQTLNINVTNDLDLFTIDLEPDPSTSFIIDQTEELIISNVKFEVPDGDGGTYSSINSGSIDLLDRKGHPMTTLELENKSLMTIVPFEKLTLTSLKAYNKILEMAFYGKINEIMYGPTKESLQNQNPTIFAWWLKNYLIFVLFIIALGIVSSIILLKNYF